MGACARVRVVHTDGADDERDGLCKAAQDVVGVFDGYCDDEATERLPEGREPREWAEASKQAARR